MAVLDSAVEAAVEQHDVTRCEGRGNRGRVTSTAREPGQH